jgi:uncharacterized coiled-coil DUF342 family protein
MKQIFSKIAKIGEEVRAAQPIKIDLGKIDDTRALMDKADATFRQATNQASKLAQAFDEAQKLYREALDSVDKIEQFIKQAEADGFPQDSVKPAVGKFKSEATAMIKQAIDYASNARVSSKF